MLNLLLSLQPLLHQGKVGIKLAIVKNVEPCNFYSKECTFIFYRYFNKDCQVLSGEKDIEKNKVNEVFVSECLWPSPFIAVDQLKTKCTLHPPKRIVCTPPLGVSTLRFRKCVFYINRS